MTHDLRDPEIPLALIIVMRKGGGGAMFLSSHASNRHFIDELFCKYGAREIDRGGVDSISQVGSGVDMF